MKSQVLSLFAEKETESIETVIKKGIDYLVSIQDEKGCWIGDYGGPMFLLPMHISVCYITGEPIPEEDRLGFTRYLFNVQNADGSIGLHAEDEGCMFTTVLCYASLRILGVARNNPDMEKMRGWIIANGTALGAASWGKFFLCLLNLYPYEGITPLLPELWALPSFLPFHPSKLWCHARQVYLPMAFLYGIRARIPENSLIREIRRDIYDTDYNAIDFDNYRNYVASVDNYRPFSRLLKMINRIQLFYEKHHSIKFRDHALSVLFEHILFEDRVTNYIDIGPVNSVLNTLVHYYDDPGGHHFKKSFISLMTYLCEGHDGKKMNGYNSTALWDTAFAVQSLFSTGLEKDYEAPLRKAYSFIRNNQILEDVPDHKRYYRHRSRGGWPFSDREHGWPITDCTAEGLKAEGLLRGAFAIDPSVPADLLEDAVRLILSFQNSDGGWATYEKQRGGTWLELLNPSSVFGDIMIDYSYVECSSSCIQALARIKSNYSGELRRKIDRAISRGALFLKKIQRQDGSFEGSWAVCFTYGTWFGVWGLLAAGVPVDAPEIQRACSFLLSRQNDDGGWGESYRSCKERRWINHDTSQVVNTSWALMTLVKGGWGSSLSAKRAADFIIGRQMENGDWPRESLVGVFNKTALINYENYRRYFPLWALGLYRGAFVPGIEEI
ncbi:MAG TPA: terpene cyclase/mutase family protein [Spirochaetota bacterium]|nr:terpene cyclase/mutase family protein [Spirochaetota bacterium]HPC39916.1 terpene cyclase/mutase family protein [Spirochaetota bacterium]HPL18035.1 terpene cyclase/mutase family protein [Spirochaetota bacterium]HQF08908.1 terpene cyclase/mutase family protein [Spirochaetota bacterium]HQH97834.1 terpene cyclase/mutase family protein [Spirochaetota bacterium]